MGIELENSSNSGEEALLHRFGKQLEIAAGKFHIPEDDFRNLVGQITVYFSEPPANYLSIFIEGVRGERKVEKNDLKLTIANIDKLSGLENYDLAKNVLGWVHMAIVSEATYQGTTEYLFDRLSHDDSLSNHLSTTSLQKAISLGRLSTEIGIIQRTKWGEIPVFGNFRPALKTKA